MKSVELFSGCGGLALGLARAGFEHELLVERNERAVATLELNRRRGVEHVRDWNVVTDDVHRIDWTKYRGRVELVAGGPPCQPFSIAGKHRGHEDGRDMWPEVIRAVREIWPRAFLFENVRGLARPAFSQYLTWIQRALERPLIERARSERYDDHLRRLNSDRGIRSYNVVIMKVNAADFGAPQKRHRVIVAGLRRDLGIELQPFLPTHSRERLRWDQEVSGEYWIRHGFRRPRIKPARLELGLLPQEMPWRTVRDAIYDLGRPSGINNHVLQLGARKYTGHTGSSLDQPAKALKAGDHGVPGGENMVVLQNGAVRYFTVREAARLQGFPDDFAFQDTWSETMRQLGNAVPSQLSEALGRWLRSVLGQERTANEAA